MIKEYTLKDGSKRYMASVYLGVDPITGKKRRTTLRGFKSVKDAKIASAREKNKVYDYGVFGNTTTFKQVFDLWNEAYRPTVRESTYHVVMSMFDNGILPFFGNKQIGKITTPQCQRRLQFWFENYKEYRKYKGYSSQIFDYAITLGIIVKNPFDGIKMPRKQAEDKEDTLLYYSKEELETFLGFLKDDPFYYTLFRTLAFTGLRKGELQALTWSDIDFPNGTLSVNKTVAYGLNSRQMINPPKTRKSNRTITIDPITLKTLKEWKVLQSKYLSLFGHNPFSKEQYIFSNLETNSLLSNATIAHKLKSICDKHDFKYIKVHGFRHTHCSLLFEAGATLQVVQNRLGHTDASVTQIYTHVTQNQIDKTAENFAKYVNF